MRPGCKPLAAALLGALLLAAPQAWSLAAPACDKPVYLTFDTGHMAVAPLVAEVLQRHSVKVTFFLANERTRTGGASLAILAAHRFARASVIGADLSAEALALAAENIALHRLTDRVSLRQGSLWSPLAGKRFDLVLCNPPYVNAASMAELPAEFRHEPVGALAGGNDGMDLIRQIVAGARAHLHPTGLMLLEVGHEAAYFEAAFTQLEFIWLPTASGDNSVALIEHDALPQA
jgi:HemK-like putative methylase